MFEHGIGPEEIGWIQRDQFAYFLEAERRITDPAEWRTFRLRLVVALGRREWRRWAKGRRAPG